MKRRLKRQDNGGLVPCLAKHLSGRRYKFRSPLGADHAGNEKLTFLYIIIDGNERLSFFNEQIGDHRLFFGD